MDSFAELRQIYKMDGDNHILLNTTLDKLENYKHFDRAHEYTLYELVFYAKNTTRFERKPEIDANQDCDFCGNSELETLHLGMEGCLECCAPLATD